jgi:hypothetical protein
LQKEFNSQEELKDPLKGANNLQYNH